MLQQTKLLSTDFRAEYAEQTDFCDLFEREMQTFYLLAFLLTADHKKAEQVFASTLEQALKEQSVFNGWARSWIKRSLIKNAIGMISPTSAGSGGQRELWGAGAQGVAGEDEINALTLLPALQRFVFVMSILERYSAWECSALLGCSAQKVVRSRSQALRELPGPAQFHSRPERRLPYLEQALT
jgi:DNA-directed RNA polymerase specialized sigma24 family protein